MEPAVKVFWVFDDLFRAAAFAAVALFVTTMPASELNFQYIGPEVPPSLAVNHNRIDAPRSSGNQVAGAFEFVERRGTISNSSLLKTFVAWCFDPDTNLQGRVLPSSLAPNLLNSEPLCSNTALSTAAGRIQKLFDKAQDPTTVLISYVLSAAFQFAIWETLYDDNFSRATSGWRQSRLRPMGSWLV